MCWIYEYHKFNFQQRVFVISCIDILYTKLIFVKSDYKLHSIVNHVYENLDTVSK